jgi:hypothetical protein
MSRAVLEKELGDLKTKAEKADKKIKRVPVKDPKVFSHFVNIKFAFSMSSVLRTQQTNAVF